MPIFRILRRFFFQNVLIWSETSSSDSSENANYDIELEGSVLPESVLANSYIALRIHGHLACCTMVKKIACWIITIFRKRLLTWRHPTALAQSLSGKTEHLKWYISATLIDCTAENYLHQLNQMGGIGRHEFHGRALRDNLTARKWKGKVYIVSNFDSYYSSMAVTIEH